MAIEIFDKNENAYCQPSAIKISEGDLVIKFIRYKFGFITDDEEEIDFDIPISATKVTVYSDMYFNGKKDFIIPESCGDELKEKIESGERLVLEDVSEYLHHSDTKKQELLEYIREKCITVRCSNFLYLKYKFKGLFKNKENEEHTKVLLSLLGFYEKLPISKHLGKVLKKFKNNSSIVLDV